MEGERRRLEQFILQTRARNPIYFDSRFLPQDIDRIRLIQAQREAGSKPVSEKLLKQQKKRKKKARRGKQLRGEVARSIREQKRFERGERRDKPEDEPRIVGEPRVGTAGIDPDIERRRLDIQERAIQDANLRAIADRRAADVRQQRELEVRRGELAAGRAERRLERERIAALPPPAPPAPVVVPPAQVRVEGPQVRVEAPQIQVEAPAAPPPAQIIFAGDRPERDIPDPVPELTRLRRDIGRAGTSLGDELRRENRRIHDEYRQAIAEQTRLQEQNLAQIRERQQAQDEELRLQSQRQDAIYQNLGDRLGQTEASMAEARDTIIDRLEAQEQRLLRARTGQDRPANYDEVVINEFDREQQQPAELPAVPRADTDTEEEQEEEDRGPRNDPDNPTIRIDIQEQSDETPVGGARARAASPEPELEPEEPPQPQGAVIAGGGELQLPDIVIEDRPLEEGEQQRQNLLFSQELPERLRLSPEEQARLYPRPAGFGASGPSRGGPGPLRGARGGASPTSPRSIALSGRALALEAQQQLDDLEQEELGIMENRLGLSPRTPRSPSVARPSSPELGGGAQAPRAGGQSPAERLAELLSPEPRRQQTEAELQRLLAEEPPTPSPTRSPSPRRSPVITTGSPRAAAIPVAQRVQEIEAPAEPEGPGILQQAGEAVGGAVVAGAGAVGRTGLGVVQGIGEGIYERLPAAPDVGVVLGRGLVAGAEVAGNVAMAGGSRVLQAGAGALGYGDVEAEPELIAGGGDVEELEEEELDQPGRVQNPQPDLRDQSLRTFQSSAEELSGQVRPGPRGARGARGGLGFRVRNNTDRTIKRIEPGDVVDVIGVEQGDDGRGRYRLDTAPRTAGGRPGSRVGADQIQGLIENQSLLFERGHRHELGGHFDREQYGPPPVGGAQTPLLQEADQPAVGAAEAELEQELEEVGGGD